MPNDYRLSDHGVLLRKSGVMIHALVKGEWTVYPEMTKDWYTASTAVDAAEAARLEAERTAATPTP